MIYEENRHFRVFVGDLERIIARHGDDNSTERQRGQVERLVRLELQFRKELIRHRWGRYVYQDFIEWITEERNILEARPFFRERNPVFNGYISDILRKKNYRALYRYHINFRFISYVMRSRKWHSGSKISKLHKDIVLARKELVELNMPLAISQARIFWSKMQKGPLEYMDFVQIATEGLVAAIDKFVPPYTTVFRTVAAHRMRGNFIESFSDPYLHFYPKDRRRLYQAFKFIRSKSRSGTSYTMEELVEHVNKNLKPNEHTNVSEITNLLQASSVVSGHSTPSDRRADEDDEASLPILNRYSDPDGVRPDIQTEERQLKEVFGRAVEKLNLFERKLLRMKGVEIDV